MIFKIAAAQIWIHRAKKDSSNSNIRIENLSSTHMYSEGCVSIVLFACTGYIIYQYGYCLIVFFLKKLSDLTNVFSLIDFICKAYRYPYKQVWWFRET